jgi:SAM-dependent methyltransferase
MSDAASSFGTVADAYERARPSYPAALVEWLAVGTTDAVDVGCGTGKLGRLLAGRGVRVVGVEHDERMAAVARRAGLAVEVARFEDWDAGRRRFDLVASAQAWHWIDARAGARKAADVLRPGGRLAVIWNLYGHDAEAVAVFDDVYGRLAPELRGAPPLGVEDGGAPLDGVDETGAFGPQQRRTDVWRQRYSAAEWVDQLATHSTHALLPDGRRTELLEAVAAALPDGLTVTYTTLTITATRV